MGDVSTSGAGVFVSGQIGVDAPQLNAIQGNSVVNPSFYSGKPVETQNADSDVILVLTPGGVYNQILYSNFFKNTKWLAQALGLPTTNTLINGDFKIWQWGTLDAGATDKDYLADHWIYRRSAGLTGVIQMTQQDINLLSSQISLPSGYKPRYSLLVNVTTAQASLAAGDFAYVAQPVELTEARKLFGGASSAQVWIYSGQAGTYTFFIQNAGGTQTYKQDFTVGTPNVWTQLTLPNIPVFPAQNSGWGTAETDLSYVFGVCFACGTNFQDANQSTWSANNHLGSSSTSNLFAVNANQFAICIAQHEPGPVCTQFQEEEFNLTLQKCQRYAVFLNAAPIGMTQSSSNLYDGGIEIDMLAAPTFVAQQTGTKHFTVSSGNAGTAAIQSGTGAAPSPQRATFFNSAGNWTVNVLVQVTGVLKAELI